MKPSHNPTCQDSTCPTKADPVPNKPCLPCLTATKVANTRQALPAKPCTAAPGLAETRRAENIHAMPAMPYRTQALQTRNHLATPAMPNPAATDPAPTCPNQHGRAETHHEHQAQTSHDEPAKIKTWSSVTSTGRPKWPNAAHPESARSASAEVVRENSRELLDFRTCRVLKRKKPRWSCSCQTGQRTVVRPETNLAATHPTRPTVAESLQRSKSATRAFSQKVHPAKH